MHRDSPAWPRAARTTPVLAALAAAALAAAGPADAQGGKDTGAKAGARAPAASSAAPTSALAPSAAGRDVPLPPPPAGTSLQAGAPGWLAVAAGAWAGLDGAAGGALQVDYGFLRTPPGWSRAELELRLSVMVARPSEDTQLTATIPTLGGPVSISSGHDTLNAWVVEVVPTARVRYAVHPKVSVFADGGLGLGQTVEQYQRDEMFAGHTEKSVNQTTVLLRAGGGLTVDLSPRTRLVVLPLALSLQLGTGFSAYLPSLGLAYRL